MSTVGSLYIDIVTRFARVEQDMNKLKGHLSGIEKQASKVNAMFNTVGSAATNMFGIMGAAAAVSAVVSGFRSIVDELDEIAKSAARAGMSAEELVKLKFVGHVSDASIEQITKMSQLLAQSILYAREGKTEYSALFKALNVDISGERRTFDVLVDTSKVLSELQDGWEKTALAKKIFGRAGADLIPFINALSEELDRQNVILSSETAHAAEVFNDNFTRMSDQAKLFGYSIAADVLPPLVELTGWLEKLGRNDKFRNALKSSLYATFPEIGMLINLSKGKQQITQKPEAPKKEVPKNSALDLYLQGLKAEGEESKRKAAAAKAIAEAKRRAAELKRIADQIADAEADINSKVMQNSSEKFQYEFFLMEKQAAKYREIGVQEVKIAEFVASETKRINQEKREEDSKWKSEQIKNYSEAIAKMLQEERQLKEGSIRRKIVEIDFTRGQGTAEDSVLIRDQIENYKELLAEQEKWLQGIDKNSDVSGWIAQQEQIDRTNEALKSLSQEIQKYHADLGGAAEQGYYRYLKDMPQAFSSVSDGVHDVLMDIQDGWTTLFDDVLHNKIKDFGDYFEQVGNRILQMIEEIIISASMNTLMGKSGGWEDIVGGIVDVFAAFGGGGGGGGGAVQTMIAHDGSPVGDWPRFHGGGGLASDEVPAILRKKERVLSVQQDQIFQKLAKDMNRPREVHYHNWEIKAMDGASVQKLFFENSDAIAGVLSNLFSKNHPMRRG